MNARQLMATLALTHIVMAVLVGKGCSQFSCDIGTMIFREFIVIAFPNRAGRHTLLASRTW